MAEHFIPMSLTMRWRNPIRHLVPSMFHRRLLLLGTLMFGMCLILSIQMIVMTVGYAGKWRQQVESRLTIHRIIPTARGRILDCRGRVLAADEPAYDVAVHYDLIRGRWAYRQAYRQARREHRSVWYDLSSDQREKYIADCLGPYEDQVEKLWQSLAAMGHLDREQLELQKNAVLAKVARLKTVLWSRWRDKANQVSDKPVSLSSVARPLREEYDYHPILLNIDAPTRLQIQQKLASARIASGKDDSILMKVWRQVRLVDSTARVYPLSTLTIELDRSTFPSPLRGGDQPRVRVPIRGVAVPLVGTIRRLWAEDKAPELRPFVRKRLNERPIIDYGGYQPGDRIGAWGVERNFESVLRGERGESVINRQTGEVHLRPPVPGEDVRLTLDIQLQARVGAVLSHDPRVGLMRRQFWHAMDIDDADLGQPLNGAAVVMEVATSHVLAAVSVPGYSRRDLKEKPAYFWKSDWAKINRPQIFRPLAMAYPPGSTIKPIVLASAYSSHLLKLKQTITCRGALDMKHPTRNRCWIFKQSMVGHGPLVGHDAICVSCNVFFYTLGQRFGLKRLVSWFKRFGLGRKPDSGITPEHAGQLPDLSKNGRVRWGIQDAIQMGIGQGPVEWTPLQAAAAYAALARGGPWIVPRLVQRPAEHPRPMPPKLVLDPKGVKQVLYGMYQSANTRRGTTHHLTRLHHEPVFNVPGVKIMAKSGTATAGARWIDENDDHHIQLREVDKHPGDHAWIVVLVQRPESSMPDFVIVVVAEYAGSGGAVSGPIANQILWAMRREGYL